MGPFLGFLGDAVTQDAVRARGHAVINHTLFAVAFGWCSLAKPNKRYFGVKRAHRSSQGTATLGCGRLAADLTAEELAFQLDPVR